MPHPRFSSEEIGRRGQELYDQKIRHQVEAGNKGKYLVIDIETGEYALGDDTLELSHHLHAKHPGAALYAMRIGYPGTFRMRGRSPTPRHVPWSGDSDPRAADRSSHPAHVKGLGEPPARRRMSPGPTARRGVGWSHPGECR
jgi:hypothetical protein